MKSTGLGVAALWVMAFGLHAAAQNPGELPVDAARLLADFEERDYEGVGNSLSIASVRQAIKDDGEGGIWLDLTDVERLLGGEEIDASLVYGTVCIGPCPFEGGETGFTYQRFRERVLIEAGKAPLDFSPFFEPKLNSEGWTDQGRVVVRFVALLEQKGVDWFFGMYDTIVRFRKTDEGFEKLPTLVEGPYVNLVTSDRPGEVVISYRLDETAMTQVVLSDGRRFGPTAPQQYFEVLVDGLEAGGELAYHIELPDGQSRTYKLETAPAPGHLPIRFAFTGDSRKGADLGMADFMGINRRTVEGLAARAYLEDAAFLLMGGDLVAGYTTVKADFETQIHAWKQAVAGFWHERPIYPGQGNHEALMRMFGKHEGKRLSFDRWPYRTDSAEAVLAAAFVNPENGPRPSDPTRPTYKENVFSFQYGALLTIAVNNNYWASYAVEEFGGCPEGYILPDQMDWIRAQLEAAKQNDSVKHVFLYAQEPVFPNGGHLKDGMWYNGDNRTRAHHFRGGEVVPEDKGIIEVRDEFIAMVAACEKVVAVFCGDEHGYHRTLIGADVPVGHLAKDDQNGDGQIEVGEEPCSPLPGLNRDVWYIVCGGAGAPYYAEEPTPWNQYWKARGGDGYRHSSQESILIIDAGEAAISMVVYNPFGEVIDRVDNLLAGSVDAGIE